MYLVKRRIYINLKFPEILQKSWKWYCRITKQYCWNTIEIFLWSWIDPYLWTFHKQ